MRVGTQKNLHILMHIKSKKTFTKLVRLLRAIEANIADLDSVRNLNLLVLKHVLQAEKAILRHRAKQKDLNKQLRTGHGSKEASTVLRGKLKRVASYIIAQQDQVYIGKCFGDALVYVYLDKFSIKHAYFETDRYAVKEGAGMLLGKDGLSQEVAAMAEAISHGIPAVLCDITNILRYGDICLLGGSDPFLIEIKSRNKLNKRAKRQIAKLEVLHEFLETDEAKNFRGGRGVTKRISLGSPERDNVDELNKCIASAKKTGQEIVQPESGVTYVAIYGKPDFNMIKINVGNVKPTIFTLNSYKTNREWAPYMPFVLSIRDADHLLDFIEGRLFLIVLVDPEVLLGRMSVGGWEARYRPDSDYVIQLLHRETKAYMGISSQFFARLALEFVSLEWMAEMHASSLQHLAELPIGDVGPVEPEEHRRLLLKMLGSSDNWV